MFLSKRASHARQPANLKFQIYDEKANDVRLLRSRTEFYRMGYRWYRCTQPTGYFLSTLQVEEGQSSAATALGRGWVAASE
jgi:hypothetical protein